MKQWFLPTSLNNLKNRAINLKNSLGISPKFPHIPRFINAKRSLAVFLSLKFIFFMCFLILFLSNIGAIIFTPENKKKGIKEVLQKPYQSQSYTKMVSELINSGAYQKAYLFNKVAESLPPINLKTLKQSDLLYIKLNEKRLISLSILNWQKIVESFPNYRDAHANLMFLNLKIGEREEAKKYYEATKIFNPNWQILEKVHL